MKNKFSVITVSVFLALLIFFTSFSVFGKKSDFSVSENRALQLMPELTLDSIGDGSFQSDYDNYLSDQFEFRDFWVYGKTKIMQSLGKKDINGVYLGKDGYLIEKYEESDFDNETVEYNIETLSTFLNDTADEGYYVTCAIVPSKGSVLTNRLPRFAEPYDTSRTVKKLKKACSNEVKFIDLTKTLKKHNDEYIYYKTDHHWTSLGAYYAYRELMKANFKDGILKASKMNSEVVSDKFLGSTFDKLQLKHKGDSITRYDTGVKVKVNFHGEAENADSLYLESALGEKSKYDYFLGGNYARVDIKTNAHTDENLLIIKDSFSNSLIPFLVKHYDKIVMLDLRYFNGDIPSILEDEDISDVFVVFNTEKFMKDENQSVLETEEEHEMTEEELENERILEEIEREERESGLLDEEEDEED
jgi:hypothetical protein